MGKAGLASRLYCRDYWCWRLRDNAVLMETIADFYGPIFGFITLVIVLAKMHANQETMAEKIKVLFELWNSRDK